MEEMLGGTTGKGQNSVAEVRLENLTTLNIAIRNKTEGYK